MAGKQLLSILKLRSCFFKEFIQHLEGEISISENGDNKFPVWLKRDNAIEIIIIVPDKR